MPIHKIIRQLKNIGLNSYEVKIWTALLSRGVSTAGELSDIANVPRSRSYDVLKSLEKKGFVVAKADGKPTKYTAIPPKKAIKKTIQTHKKNTYKEIKILNELKNDSLVEELKLLYSQGNELVEPNELTGSLKGRSNFYNHLGYTLGKAEKTILISTTPKEFTILAEKFKLLFKKLKNKNVNIKILTQINNQTKKYVGKIKQFTEVKHTDNKARFCIVDGKEIIFMVLDDNDVHPTYDVGIWVNTPLARELERFT